MERRTALILIVPEAESVVATFRARYAAESLAKRIPAHITLLIPYVAASRLDDVAVSSAREHFGSFAPLDAELVEVGRFTEHVWLAPSPREPFVGLIQDTCRRFPESPYGETFPNPVPHLTVGQATPSLSAEEIARTAEEELGPQLPVAFRVDAAWLLVEQEDGTWIADERLPFAA